MAYIYVLQSDKDKKTYVGSTNDIERRINEHEAGKVSATKHRRPLQLIYQEKFFTIGEARTRERYLKTASGRRWMKKYLFDS